MNKYPSYLTTDLKPLAFLIGEVELEPIAHKKLVAAIEAYYKNHDNKEHSNITFRSVPIDYNFREKKPAKESYSTEGILKYNWPSKHHEQIPSVLLYTVAFNVEWSVSEWVREESRIQETYNRLKTVLINRDIKVIVIVLRVGTGQIEKDVMDDRINSLKRHLQLDTKSFVFMPAADIIPESSGVKRISKSAREFSTNYYSSRIKSYKIIEKGIGERYKGKIEAILLARFNFKIAYFYEFYGQQLAQSLRYYRQCYRALATSLEYPGQELTEQVKMVGEMVHFKICNILLISKSVGEAFQQFKSHITLFIQQVSEFPWKHYAWVADQYLVFTQLLETFAINDAMPDADRAYYYQNAARFNQKRHASFEKIRVEMETRKGLKRELVPIDCSEAERPVNSFNSSKTEFKGMILTAPKFIGSPLQLLDPVLDQLQPVSVESHELYVEFLQEEEQQVNHGAIIMSLLKKSLEKLNLNFKRRRGLILSMIAEQRIQQEDYVAALQHLKEATELLVGERWVAPSISLLELTMRCAIVLGKPIDYLKAGLTLYAHAGQEYLSRHQLEDLHLNIMSLFVVTLVNPNVHCSEKPRESEERAALHERLVMRNRASFISSYQPLFARKDYGSAAEDEWQKAWQNAGDAGEGLTGKRSGEESTAVQYSLPNNYVVDMTGAMQMFQVSVTFGRGLVEVGQTVTVGVSVLSKFLFEVAFDQMRVFFTEEAIVQDFIDGSNPNLAMISEDEDEDAAGSPGTNNPIPVSLVFPPNQAATFSFEVFISEQRFGRFANVDAVVCVERVELILRHKIGQELPPPAFNNELSSPHSVSSDYGYLYTPQETKNRLSVNLSAEPSLQVELPVTPKMHRETSDIAPPTPSSDTPILKEIQDPLERVITLHVATLSPSMRRVRRGPGKACSLKDLVEFCAMEQEGFPVLSIRKPTALLSLIKPLGEVSLLQGMLQRIDLQFTLGECDMEDGYLWLESSYTPKNPADSVFWYPDKEQLAEVLERGDVSGSSWNEVQFHPISLGPSMQPLHPIFLCSSMMANSSFMVPLFVKSGEHGRFDLQLRVEYVPKGIMKSTLSRDFKLKLNFVTPYQMEFLVTAKERKLVLPSASGLNVSSVVEAGKEFMLSAKLRCQDSLRGSLGLYSMVFVPNNVCFLSSKAIEACESAVSFLVLNKDDEGDDRKTIDLFQKIVKTPVKEDKNLTIKDKIFPVVMHRGEAFAHNLHFTPYCDSITKTPKPTGVSPGSVRLDWTLIQRHILSPPGGEAKDPSIAEGGPSGWLYEVGLRNSALVLSGGDSEKEKKDIFDLKESAFCSSVLEFTIPPLKVIVPPFELKIEAPTTSTLGECFNIKVLIQSHLYSLERIQLRVQTTDNFVITGPASATFEISPLGIKEIILNSLPLRCGNLCLPHIVVSWDKGMNNISRLLAIGEIENPPQFLFIRPK